MYTEEYENKGFPLLSLIFKIILIIAFVFFLVWIIPKIYFSFTNKGNNNNKNNGTCKTIYADCLKPQTYNKNIKAMKEAALTYYTEERLPKRMGDNASMTLEEMLNKKLLISLLDKNQKVVDVKNSYVNIIKLDNEYVMKVSIKDSEKEDFILVHLGCYDYCQAFICEKEGETASYTNNTTYYDVPAKSGKEEQIFIVPAN